MRGERLRQAVLKPTIGQVLFCPIADKSAKNQQPNILKAGKGDRARR